IQEQAQANPGIALGLGGQVIGFTVFLSSLVAFDFRSDVDQMDVLKALPIAPIPLVIGQLFAPVLFLSLVQWCALALIRTTAHRQDVINGLAMLIPFVVPFNCLLIGIDNLLFLLFPVRTVAVSPGDFQAMGRQLLLTLVKCVALGLATGLAVLVA